MIAPDFRRELAREREKEIARRRAGLLAEAAPTISIVLGIALLAAVCAPVVP